VKAESSESFRIPFYVKLTIFLVGFIALLAILIVAKSIIFPIIFAFIIAIVLHPVVKFLTRIKINRVVAIAFTLLLTFLLIFGFINIFIGQVSRFSESWPVLVERLTLIVNQAISNISNSLEINPQ
jgi:predicted PurR-regulated permease PerM